MASRKARLEQLKAQRASGKGGLNSFQVQENQNIYDEVDEEGYKKVIRKRLDQDDFVVDDNGDGYADDGREDWDTRQPYETDSEEERQPAKNTKAGKRKRDEDREKIERTNHSINDYLKAGAAAQKAKPKPRAVATAEDDDFMANLLVDVDTNIPSKRPAPAKVIKSETRRKVRVLSPPLDARSRAKPAKADIDLPDTPPAVPASDDEPFLPNLDDDDDVVMSDPAPLPSSPTTKAVQRKTAAIKIEPDEDEDEDDMMEVAQAATGHALSGARANFSGSKPPKKELKKPAYPTPESSSPSKPPPASSNIDPASWNDVNSKLNILSSPSQTAAPGKLDVSKATEEDGTVRFFWMDYLDVNGSLYLFGKVQDKSSSSYVSAVVRVDNIERKLFFLPRERKMKRGRLTDEDVDMSDVFEEVETLMTNLRVPVRKCKPVERKYAFEMQDIPKEAEYLKVMYPYNKPALTTVTEGETFSHVFGANTALFEQFVLWKKIMGPCWLQIDAESFGNMNNASWCKLELQLSNPKSIVPLPNSDNMDAPPLTVMSLAFRTTHNAKENKQEILIASARVYENVSLKDSVPAEKLPCRTFTIMRPVDSAYPTGFEAACKKQIGTIMCEKTEQMLLSKFMVMLERADPDVLMGHGLQDVDYPTLLSRMRERKTPGWHRIGRLRRSEWPKTGKFGAGFWAEREIRAGRLMCDIANDLGKSLMSKCQSWSLTEMSDIYLPKGTPRQELDNEVALKTWASTRDGLMNYTAHCEADTHFISAIAIGVQILPLSKVLTNLAGNSWARTLSGTRAERNEYILLHEFYEKKYICPDKVWGKSKIKVEDAGNGETEETGEGRKKAKYEGGLVFEPEKGLYDKFILVMDFNSLYPSIIQEYNICFTTVDRAECYADEEKVPDVPNEPKEGILPGLIKNLVERRKGVKSLMKDKNATPEQLATWDIRQMALKLTANSMYGCLGYTQSRFYARPLAMLTTYKGREILRDTKDLVENATFENTPALHVVYGDTDSVMINTNADNVQAALTIGSELKKTINGKYKLLEIDIDNIFKRLLLHAKKKYAAINLIESGGKFLEKLEVKGLDMRRREYCALSKEASSRILNEALSGDDTEVTVSKIQEYLRTLAQQMREEKIPNQKYTIFTKLGKDPRSYPNPDSMPQVQVALRAIKAGKTVRINDVISYITTTTTAEDATGSGSSDHAAKRAYSPMDVQKSDGALKPDVDWYLAKQLFPPIERLCAPIDGMDAVLLAECLGLDPKRYASMGTAARTDKDALDFAPMESQLPDEVRYKDCPRLSLKCLGCQKRFEWQGFANSRSCATPKGIVCPESDGGCGKIMKTLTVVAQVEHQVRNLASSYYDAWLRCDDASCEVRTRSMSVYGTRCLGPHGLAKGCLGKVSYEKAGSWVARTLGYWKTCFDVNRQLKARAANEEEREAVKALAEWNRVRFETVRGVLEQYERNSGWVWVQMDQLFAWALKNAN